jgi:hypothetical protein
MNSLRARNEHLAKMSDRAVAEFEAARGTPREAAARLDVERHIEILKVAMAETQALRLIKAAPARWIGG